VVDPLGEHNRPPRRGIREVEGEVAQRIVGRDAELAAIDAFVEGRGGTSILHIDGESGMGKTTLWQAAIERARAGAIQVLAARPNDAEATFSYAGLGDLFRDVDDDALSRLPPPQLHSLRVALLREEPEGRVPDAHVVAVAALNALRELARSRPVLVAIDDIQWLDPSSALVIGFAIHRLREAAVRFLMVDRVMADPGPLLGRIRREAGYERILVGSLGLTQFGRLLQERLSTTFSRLAVRRIHDASGGNPLFGLELARVLIDRPGALEAGADIPVPDDLVMLIGQRISSLPRATRAALSVAAFLATPTIAVISEALGETAPMIDPAIQAGVVTLEQGRLRFTHPLGAAAVRRATSSARRRAIHRSLADANIDPEERARHLAMAAEAPDASIAAVLEEASRRARARGAPDAAADLAGLASRLTPPGLKEDAARRKLIEASNLAKAGDVPTAVTRAEEVLGSDPPPVARREALAHLGYYHGWGRDSRLGIAYFRRALEEAGGDDRFRMSCEGNLTGALDFLGEDFREALQHGYLELALAEELGEEVNIAAALRGIARNEQRLTGRMPLDKIERSLRLEPLVRESERVSKWPSYCFAEMLCWTDDVAAGITRWEWLLGEARDRGELDAYIDILSHAVPYMWAAGDWSGALARAEEGHELARDAGWIVLQATLAADTALVLSHLGDEIEARRYAASASELGGPSAAKSQRTAAWALGSLELSLGNPRSAIEWLRPLVASRRSAGVAEPGDLRFVPDYIEALIRADRSAEARAALDWYEGLARAAGRVHAIAACERCRGMLSAVEGDLDGAIDALEAARDGYGTIRDPFGSARTLYVLGTLERRRLHKRAARTALEDALAGFEALGARTWARTALEELGRISGRAKSRDGLTPGERQVAALVAEGHSNREVARKLFVAERTVEGHLSNIYAKLGIRSRAELAHLLADGRGP
jgi:DNA-binding CsgD family transcriptional regulator